MKYHSYFLQKLEKMSQNLSSAAVVIGSFFFSMLKKKITAEKKQVIFPGVANKQENYR